MLSGKKLFDKIKDGKTGSPFGISISPCPDFSAIDKGGGTSIDLRLGRWFLSFKQTRATVLNSFKDPGGASVTADQAGAGITAVGATSRQFVPFGKDFILHPHRFVLGATLEWVRLPQGISGHITGKSTWARHGVSIEAADLIHPGFSGCLTLEIRNQGEIPIALRPGVTICQIVVFETSDETSCSNSGLAGRRRPYLGSITTDDRLNQFGAS